MMAPMRYSRFLSHPCSDIFPCQRPANATLGTLGGPIHVFKLSSVPTEPRQESILIAVLVTTIMGAHRVKTGDVPCVLVADDPHCDMMLPANLDTGIEE